MSATVRQIIEFKGQDNATKVANDVKKGLDGVGVAADKASKKTAEIGSKGLDEVREKSGDVESALKGISDFAGASSDEVSKLGDSFGAVEAVMRLLPGPIGLVASGIAGAAIGAKLLYDYLSQSAAKERLLVSGAAATLAADLKLGEDGAAALSAAMADLGDKARPSNLLLGQVAANAKAMGAEPAAAVAKFIAAWKDGPDAVRKVQAELGNLKLDFASIPDAAKLLGLDAVALGLEEAVTAQKRLNTELERSSLLRSEIEGQQKAVAEATRIASSNTSGYYQTELIAQIKILQAMEAKKAVADETARKAAAEITATKDLADLEASRGRQAQYSAASAALAGTQQESQKIRLSALATQQTDIESEIATILNLQAAFGADFAKGKVEALTLAKLQLEVQKKQILDADAAAKKAEASAKRAAGQQAAEKARAKQKAAAEEQRKIIDDGFKAQNELQAKLEADQAFNVEKQLAGQEAIRKAKIAATVDPAQRGVLEVEDIKARKIAELAAVEAQTRLTSDTKALLSAEIQMRAAADVGAAQVRAFDAAKDSAKKLADEQRALTQSAIDLVGPAAQMAAAFGGPSGTGAAMAAAVQSARQLAGSWSDTESNASGIIGAVGNVAAAVVDGEREKAAVLGVMEAAQAIALAFVPGKQAEAAGHGAAALLYGGIATGLIGGSSAAPAAGGFSEQATATAAGGQTSGGGGMTVVNNYNAPLGTRYEIGKSVAESAKAAKAWAKTPAGV
jgi:hypothetical protein